MDGGIYITFESLENLRGLLVFGWMLLFCWFGLTLFLESAVSQSKPNPKKWDPDAYCPIGRTDQASCYHCRKTKE